MVKPKTNEGIVYRPKRAYRVFVFGIGSVLVFIHALILRGMVANGLQMPTLGLLLLIDLWFITYSSLVLRTRLTISSSGIELKRGGSYLQAEWKQISHFGIQGDSERGGTTGIFLINKCQPKSTGLIARLFYSYETNFIPIELFIHMPIQLRRFRLGIDHEKLAHTDFGQHIAQFAPHLLNETG